MQHLTEEVTRRLVSRLPESKAYYSLSDLHDFQIPAFMINRIELELRRNLADSIVPPDTDWANMDSSNVKVSWENFLKAIHEQVRLPRAFAHSVFEVCVGDILELLSQPRKHMIEVIFGASKELKFEEIRQAASLITVYHYLPDALIKYMHRKQLASITKERAQHILVLVDEKITSAYTPLNWAQLIDPFYVLLGEAIETELLRQFFSDKGKTRWAEFFDKEHNDITRTRFIEVLSMPIFDGIEPYEQEFGSEYKQKEVPKPIQTESHRSTISIPHQNDFSIKPVEQVETSHSIDSKNSEVSEMATTSVSSETSIKEDQEEPVSQTNYQLDNSSFQTETHNDKVEESKEDTVTIQNSYEENIHASENHAENHNEAKPMKAVTNYVFNDETMEFEKITEYVSADVKEVNPIEEKPNPKISEFTPTHSSKPLTDEPLLKSFDPYADILKSSPINESTEKAQPKAKNFEDLDDDVPIYKKLEAENATKSQTKPLVDQIKQEDDVPFWKRFMPLDPPKAKPIVTKETDPSELFDFLAENEEIYIAEIFGTVQNNYVEAIQDLANYVYWEQASKYIKEEIFRANRISPLDDAALDFISRLQEWFINKNEG
jgi:hypothetical protein